MNHDWSLNDVCCYVPAWFGVIATSITGLIAYESSVPPNTTSNVVQFIWDIVYGTTTCCTNTNNNNHDEKSSFPPNNNNNNTNNGTNKGTLSSSAAAAAAAAVACAVFAMAMMSIVPAHLTRSVGGGFDNERYDAFVLFCFILFRYP